MSKSNVFAGDHAEDVKVLRTVCQGQFNLHAVVVGIGEDAVLRYVLSIDEPFLRAACCPLMVSIIKNIG